MLHISLRCMTLFHPHISEWYSFSTHDSWLTVHFFSTHGSSLRVILLLHTWLMTHCVLFFSTHGPWLIVILFLPKERHLRDYMEKARDSMEKERFFFFFRVHAERAWCTRQTYSHTSGQKVTWHGEIATFTRLRGERARLHGERAAIFFKTWKKRLIGKSSVWLLCLKRIVSRVKGIYVWYAHPRITLLEGGCVP